MSDALLFGYGSLIHEDSRNKSATCNEVWPVELLNFERSWEIHFERTRMTCVGIHPAVDKRVHGVVFRINADDLIHFDQREQGYERVTVAADDLWHKPNVSLPDLPIYTYQSIGSVAANDDYPICQSYINICLLGCLSFSRSMAESFIHNTCLWRPIKQDPPRPGFEPNPQQQQVIDELMHSIN